VELAPRSPLLKTTTTAAQLSKFMPETTFTIGLPDGSQMDCYSPSSIVLDYFSEGDVLTNSIFLTKAQESLKIASDRVEEKYGFQCTGALNSLKRIQKISSNFKHDDKIVVIKI